MVFSLSPHLPTHLWGRLPSWAGLGPGCFAYLQEIGLASFPSSHPFYLGLSSRAFRQENAYLGQVLFTCLLCAENNPESFKNPSAQVLLLRF